MLCAGLIPSPSNTPGMAHHSHHTQNTSCLLTTHCVFAVVLDLGLAWLVLSCCLQPATPIHSAHVTRATGDLPTPRQSSQRSCVVRISLSFLPLCCSSL